MHYYKLKPYLATTCPLFPPPASSEEITKQKKMPTTESRRESSPSRRHVGCAFSSSSSPLPAAPPPPPHEYTSLEDVLPPALMCRWCSSVRLAVRRPLLRIAPHKRPPYGRCWTCWMRGIPKAVFHRPLRPLRRKIRRAFATLALCFRAMKTRD
ncbi:hypothetical protein DM860_006134 [Cuscuta australis]|uniref:Uncharacterized protein n=1 Tax=Cuscuta australis TaxID=267555 RepID=A0A328DL36_9ASTE|nr:hypothetical protein DM860_006134 [Cuscuta australis]